MGKKSSKDKKKKASEKSKGIRNRILPLIILPIAVLLFIVAKRSSWFEGGNVNESNEISSTRKDNNPPNYVGGKICLNCHQEQFEQWSGSHHDLAMQVANDKSVLGNFNDTEFKYFGVSSKFYRSDEKYMVFTDGPDGKLKGYEIKYTFGYYPLQQYLIEFPGGRLQALGIAWDTRPKSEGGQRWFHLYPDEEIKNGDILHWSGINQNWNFMCAECHSTNLNKNYNAETNSYDTTWSDIDVSCESCHGPGSNHVKWAEIKYEKNKTDSDSQKGLLVRLDRTSWVIDPETGIAKISGLKSSKNEIEICSQCHSRRAEIWKDYKHGKPFMDSYMPALLDESLYYPDGQIKEEVYVYGSFLQSKMYNKGVSCSDCHEPHSLKLRKSGNELCTGCHLSSRYDTKSHYFHNEGSDGSSCVECHMPETKYMVVDPRHDHSIRIPRPDLTEKLGIPNACNKCHENRTSSWAEKKVKEWYGTNTSSYNNYVKAFHAARTRLTTAEALLLDIANDKLSPNIVRGTALKELGNYISPQSIDIIKKGLKDSDPLVRLGAIDALERVDPTLKLQLAFNLLYDPVRAVRIKTIRILSSVPENQLTVEQKKVLENSTYEYIKSQRFNADRPEAHLNLGLLYTEQGKFNKAEKEYNKAIELHPSFVQAYVNLADLYRLQGKDDQGGKLLLHAIKLEPDNAGIYHAYGLLLVRQKRTDEALEALEKAAKLSADNPRYSYVYAVALNSVGKPNEAIEILELSHARSPNDRETLYALVTFNRDIGKIEKSIDYAEKLIALSPWDTSARQLLEQLK